MIPFSEKLVESKVGDLLDHNGELTKYDDNLYCPHCGEKQYDYMEDFREKEEWSATYCGTCDREFEFQVDIILRGGEYYGNDGVRSRIPPCDGGHQWVLYERKVRTTEWSLQENGVVDLPKEKQQILSKYKCRICGDETFSFGEAGNTFMLPWKQEYNDPAFFDPAGLLASPLPVPTIKCLECMHTAPEKDFVSFSAMLTPYYECPECGQESENIPLGLAPEGKQFRFCTILDTPFKGSPTLKKALDDCRYRRHLEKWYYEKMADWRNPEKEYPKKEPEKPEHMRYKPWQPVNVQAEVDKIVRAVEAKRDKYERRFDGTHKLVVTMAPGKEPVYRITYAGEEWRLSEQHTDKKGVVTAKYIPNVFYPMPTLEEARSGFRRLGKAIGGFLSVLLLIGCSHQFDPNKPYSIHRTDSLYNESTRTTEQPDNERGKSKGRTFHKTRPTVLPCEAIFIIQDGRFVGWFCANQLNEV